MCKTEVDDAGERFSLAQPMLHRRNLIGCTKSSAG